jgi:hypothetical protein
MVLTTSESAGRERQPAKANAAETAVAHNWKPAVVVEWRFNFRTPSEAAGALDA